MPTTYPFSPGSRTSAVLIITAWRPCRAPKRGARDPRGTTLPGTASSTPPFSLDANGPARAGTSARCPSPPLRSRFYRRAVNEGDRRLSATGVELLATDFNAGFTIVFGIAALSIVHGLIEPTFGPEVAKLAGAAGFGIGLLFLVTSRAELFTENFFDPVATAFHRGELLLVLKLLRLRIVVLGLNLIGGAILVLILSVDGVLPPGSERSLRTVAEEIAAKDVAPAFANAVVGGAIVTLLSFLLQAVDRVLSRMVVAYLIGFLLAVGPFAHVVVTAQHLLFGASFGAPIGFDDIAADIGIAMVGNLLGGLGFVTLTHLAQARGEGARIPANDVAR